MPAQARPGPTPPSGRGPIRRCASEGWWGCAACARGCCAAAPARRSISLASSPGDHGGGTGPAQPARTVGARPGWRAYRLSHRCRLSRAAERSRGRRAQAGRSDEATHTLRVSYPFSLVHNNWGGEITVSCVAEGQGTRVGSRTTATTPVRGWRRSRPTCWRTHSAGYDNPLRPRAPKRLRMVTTGTDQRSSTTSEIAPGRHADGRISDRPRTDRRNWLDRHMHASCMCAQPVVRPCFVGSTGGRAHGKTFSFRVMALAPGTSKVLRVPHDGQRLELVLAPGPAAL